MHKVFDIECHTYIFSCDLKLLIILQCVSITLLTRCSLSTYMYVLFGLSPCFLVIFNYNFVSNFNG